MEVRLGTAVSWIGEGRVTLWAGRRLPTGTVVWTVGVTPPHSVRAPRAGMKSGRLVVDERLPPARGGVGGAAGDSAAAWGAPSARRGADYPPTAQHAQRQGLVIGRNVAASLGVGRARRYRHRDLGPGR